MHTEHNNIDFGIYIDHKRAFVIALDHGIHEEFLEEITEIKEGHVGGSHDVNQQLHIQNKKNEALKKFCRAIIVHLERAHRILVFGPAELKFELRREIEAHKSLKHISLDLETSDYMEKEAAVKFATEFFRKKL